MANDALIGGLLGGLHGGLSYMKDQYEIEQEEQLKQEEEARAEAARIRQEGRLVSAKIDEEGRDEASTIRSETRALARSEQADKDKEAAEKRGEIRRAELQIKGQKELARYQQGLQLDLDNVDRDTLVNNPEQYVPAMAAGAKVEAEERAKLRADEERTKAIQEGRIMAAGDAPKSIITADSAKKTVTGLVWSQLPVDEPTVEQAIKTGKDPKNVIRSGDKNKVRDQFNIENNNRGKKNEDILTAQIAKELSLGQRPEIEKKIRSGEIQGTEQLEALSSEVLEQTGVVVNHWKTMASHIDDPEYQAKVRKQWAAFQQSGGTKDEFVQFKADAENKALYEALKTTNRLGLQRIMPMQRKIFSHVYNDIFDSL